MGLPVEINNLMLGSLGGYTVGRSLRFRSSASARLTRTPTVAGNQRTWTWSGWVKRGSLGNQRLFWAGYTNGATADGLVVLGFNASDQLQHYVVETGVADRLNYSNAVYRDPSAWYHIVFIYDSTQATAANRQRIFVNGVEITSWAATSYVSQNYQADVNSTSFLHGIGYYGFNNTFYFDGYIAEVNFIDGQALTPSSFGAYDTNGVWQPKKYTGTYGTNGFYLPFSDNSALTTASNVGLGKDFSGNGNYWVTNNISITAGTTYDSMIDSPTNAAGTSTGIGNYAVLNPLDTSSVITLSEANLKHTGGASFTSTRASIWMSSGKWYWEATVISGGNYSIGIGTASVPLSANFGNNANGYSYLDNGNKQNGGTITAYAGTMAANDVIGVTFDADTGTLAYYKNNVSLGTAFSGLTSGPFFPMLSGQGSVIIANFGQRPFTYTPPSGFKALNTYNLTAPSIPAGNKHFDISLWTGTGVAQSITNSGSFQPDFVWDKSRNNAGLTHVLTDSVRGVNSQLFSPLTNSEETRTDRITSFNSNGFTVGTYTDVNQSAQTFVGWQWKGGGTGVTNNSGTITSTVSANTPAGFSIVTYTGTGSAGATVGHGLGIAPEMIIWKNRSSVQNWIVYNSVNGNTGNMYLNLTNGFSTDSTILNNTTPTSSVFTLGTSGAVNGSGNSIVAYCFNSVRGFSSIGKYTGNGSSDGPFIYTGFRPRWVMIKRSSGVGNWFICDTSRDTYNVAQNRLFPSVSNAEATSPVEFDILSNGFKIRVDGATDNGTNFSGDGYVYMAFAENPFNYSRAR